jgi:transposase
LDSLSAEQLHALAAELIAQVAQREQAIASKDGELKYRQAKIDQLTHEMAVLKRWRFGRSGERLDPATSKKQLFSTSALGRLPNFVVTASPADDRRQRSQKRQIPE